MSILQTATVFADGLDHPECIAVHRDGSVWAGGEAGQIYKIDATTGKATQVATTNGFILGIAFSPDCSWLLVCDSGNKVLWKLDTTSFQLAKFASGGGGHSFNIPNYACFDRGGNVYVSESGAFRQITGKVLKFDAGGKGEVWAEGPFNFANGMAIDAKEEYIYVVCSFMPGIERIAIQKNGTAGKREVFATLPESVPDGAAFDANGNLLVSCYAPNKVYSIAPDRSVHVLVDDWEAHTLSNPTNMAFGGENFDELYVANIGRWHITKLSVGVKGQKLVSHL